MDILNLKNSIATISMLLFLQCDSVKDQDYVLSDEFPPIVIMNATDSEIKQSILYLKRKNATVDTGQFRIYSKSENKVDVQIALSKKDSLFIDDKILFNLKGKEYVISDFEKNKMKSSGDPYIISYKINKIPFIEREGFIDIK
ncbi:hypothetical protein NZ698_00015 [Chryseobacterium sp. PBS4-4]|uniref:Uncharacterized protein n=1 Tax=Chryseobacterium edaphi TaxID=2976532 RepID=A0ABT2VZZ6_9FLAO|nr:hypothetical protein [Chryseobacterium edaphi]MCU7615565.1 hypothetical protein [Chryseobacterium edaphi]